MFAYLLLFVVIFQGIAYLVRWAKQGKAFNHKAEVLSFALSFAVAAVAAYFFKTKQVQALVLGVSAAYLALSIKKLLSKVS
jgi:hypothetical protein